MAKRWALALAGLAAAALLSPARQEGKSELPNDLALVPASVKSFVSIRPADLWNSDLGKELRKGLGKEADAFASEIEKRLGVGPASIERVTAASSDLRRGGYLVVKLKEKADAKLLAKLIPDGEEKMLGGQTVRANAALAAFLKGDSILVIGGGRDLKDLLESKGDRRGKALETALVRAASKHSATAFGDPTSLGLPRELPQALAMVKPLLAAKGGIVWADFGADLRAGFLVAFANKKDASRAEKTLEAARKVAIAALATYSEDLLQTSKPLAALAEAVEGGLSKASIKLEGVALTGSVGVKIESLAAVKLALEGLAKVRTAASRTRAQNNLKQIGIALHNHHDTMGAFPAHAIYSKDGKPLLSWRVAILPYIEEQGLYRQFKLDEPWDSEHNKKLLGQMPKVYAPVMGKATEPGGTFYQGFFGKGAGFEGMKGLRIASILDGSSQTLAIVEAGKDVPWTKPADIAFDAGKAVPALGGEFGDGFHAAFFDGSVRFILKSVKAETLKALITRGGGEVLGNDF